MTFWLVLLLVTSWDTPVIASGAIVQLHPASQCAQSEYIATLMRYKKRDFDLSDEDD